MNKKNSSQGLESYYFQTLRNNIYRIMKLTLLMCFLSVNMIFAEESYAQKTSLTLNLNEKSVEQVLEAVEQQSNFHFYYNSKLINTNRIVSIKERNKDVFSILNVLFNGTNVAYKVIDKDIILTVKGESVKSIDQAKGRISGTVTDTKGEPIAGANVIIKGTTTGTITDADGKYIITDVPSKSTLVVSYIGFTTQEIPVGNKSQLNVSLAEDSQQLGEVVVTALGIVKSTRTLSYATQTLKSDDLLKVRDNSSNVLSNLKGKIAGANITTATTGPGGATKVVLRGNRSISGNDNALIVVDGVPFNNPMSTQASNEFQSYNGSDGAVDINPDDILSIDVLKGATAAALYGSNAANGAIIITTKQGKEGKYSMNYNGGVSIDQPVYLMKFQNTYGRGSGGQLADGAGQSWGGKTNCYSDNVSSFYQLGNAVNNSINFQGGTKEMKSYASYTNNQTVGIVPHNWMNKNTLDLRVNTNFIPKLTTDAKITYSQYKLNNMPMIGDTGLGIDTYIMPRDLSKDELSQYETINETTGLPQRNYWTVSSVFDNPYWVNERTGRNEERNRVIAMGSAKYQILDWLSIQGRYSYDMYDNFDTQHAYQSTVTYTNSVQKGGYYSEERSKVTERNMDVLLSGNNNFLKVFGVNYNLGASSRRDSYKSTNNTTNGLSIPNKFNLAFASNPQLNVGTSTKEVHSVYGSAQFDYKKAIYLDVTGRNDWSSTLPSNYSFFYPSVGLSFILNDLVKMPEWVSLAKVRGSWSKVGNDADPYMLTQTYSYNSNTGFISPNTTKMISDLKPEKTTSTELGLDWKFFDDRLGFDFTYYNSSTANQLIWISTPWSSGYSGRYINAGKIKNHGFELSVTGRPIMTNDFTWQTTVNLSANRNKVAYLTEGINSIIVGGSAKFAYTNITEGKSVGQLTGYTWKTDEKTGKYIVNDKGLPVATDSYVDIGNYNPKMVVGWSNNFTYKHFNLSMLIDGRFGGTMVSATDAVLANYGVAKYTDKYRDGGLVLDAVKADGTQNTTAITSEQFWTTVSGGRYGWGGFFAFDATNIRLRELSLGYDFDLKGDKFIKKANLSLYGRNLFFFYRGKNRLDIPGMGKRSIPIDPDQAMGAGSFQGTEMGLHPSTRTFGFNVNLTF